jgi:zinc transporter ZupT
LLRHSKVLKLQSDLFLLNYLLKGIESRGWVAFLGDILHNITDGLALAVSFSQSPSLGISTGLAILFHEIPHEIGAFIVLRKFGFGYVPALISNLINGMISLIAFLILTSVTSQKSDWLFALTSGVFIYISIISLVFDIKKKF